MKLSLLCMNNQFKNNLIQAKQQNNLVKRFLMKGVNTYIAEGKLTFINIFLRLQHADRCKLFSRTFEAKI